MVDHHSLNFIGKVLMPTRASKLPRVPFLASSCGIFNIRDQELGPIESFSGKLVMKMKSRESAV